MNAPYAPPAEVAPAKRSLHGTPAPQSDDGALGSRASAPSTG